MLPLPPLLLLNVEKGLSWRPDSVLTATMPLLQTSHGILLHSYGVLAAIFCVLTMLSQRFNGDCNACAALSRRLHCAEGVLKT